MTQLINKTNFQVCQVSTHTYKHSQSIQNCAHYRISQRAFLFYKYRKRPNLHAIAQAMKINLRTMQGFFLVLCVFLSNERAIYSEYNSPSTSLCFIVLTVSLQNQTISKALFAIFQFNFIWYYFNDAIPLLLTHFTRCLFISISIYLLSVSLCLLSLYIILTHPTISSLYHF